jgi:hypothetical protein
MPFEKHVLADDLAGGYQVIACDVNGDGKLDLIALASDMPDLVWFENPTWKRHVLAKNMPHLINAACWSHGAGKPPTIAVAYHFSMQPQKSLGSVSILSSGDDPRQPWSARSIDQLSTSHRLRWADIEGNGNKVLINVPLANAQSHGPEYHGHVPLVYYRPGDWKRHLIGDAEEGVVHGVFVNDWDHTGREDVLIGSFLGIHLYRYEKDGKWSRTEMAKGSPDAWPKSGTSDVTVGYLTGKRGKERFLGAIEPWHGHEVVVYRQHGGSAWQREVIDDTILDGHTIEAADLDGDGQDEIVVGFRGKPYGVYIYRWNGTKWDRQILDQGNISAAGCAVADLYGSGRPDIVCIGQATHNLVLFRNAGKSVR